MGRQARRNCAPLPWILAVMLVATYSLGVASQVPVDYGEV